jgi:hypothetical protein
LALKRVQIRAFNSAQKTFERIVAACEAKDEAGWKRAAFDLLSQVQQSATRLHCASEESKPPSDLSEDQVEYLLQRIRQRSGAKTEQDLAAFKSGCDAFPTMTFPAFSAFMCPSGTQ